MNKFCYKILTLVTLGMFCGATASSSTQDQIGKVRNTSKKKNEKDTRLLEEAVKIYEQRLKNGSAAALNQIASAFYTLGEVQEKKTKGKRSDDEKAQIVGNYKKAADYFCKAAKAGCEEAVYNAGLALSKIKHYAEAAQYYRQCINKDSKTELALKSAVNLAVLILKKRIAFNEDEVKLLMNIGSQSKGKRAETLLQTAMVILTDQNAEQEEEDKVQESASAKDGITPISYSMSN